MYEHCFNVICARGLSKFRRRGFSEVQYAMLTLVNRIKNELTKQCNGWYITNDIPVPFLLKNLLFMGSYLQSLGSVHWFRGRELYDNVFYVYSQWNTHCFKLATCGFLTLIEKITIDFFLILDWEGKCHYECKQIFLTLYKTLWGLKWLQ